MLAFRHRVALRENARTLAQGIGDMPLDLLKRRGVDHRSDNDALLGAGADLHRRNPGGELSRKRVIDARLDQDAVGADAGLPAIAEFGGDCPFDRQIDIGIVEHDERRIAAQLEAEPLDAVRRPLHKQRADAGGSGERDFAHGLVGHQLLADLPRHACDDVNDTRRDAGPLRQHAKRQRRKGCELRWLDDHGAAGS